MKRNIWTLASAIGLTALAAPAYGGELWPLSVDCEAALALSASPSWVRENAGAYVLGDAGYELVREASNNYVCLVERVSDESLLPQCFDKLGQAVHVKVHLDAGRMMRAGVSWDAIRKARDEGFKSGKYRPVAGHGVVYMASDYNFFANQDGSVKLKIAPHVMFHAPDVTLEDMNSDPAMAAHNHGMPIVASAGPMGFMVSFTEKATDSSQVIAACQGQLPDSATFKSVPR